MSSKRAASRALWELFEFIKNWGGEDRIVFKPYSQMGLGTIPRATYNKRLKKFEKQGLIQKIQNPNGAHFIITKKAKFLRRKAITKIPRNDGNSTLVLFDIPEQKHNARDTLRRSLIRNGYIQMQKSSFLSPFQISEDLKDLIKELKLEKNVTIFSARVDQINY